MANTWSQRFVELKARRIDSKSSFKAGETFVFSINSSRDGSATGFLTALIFRVVDCFGCGSVVDRAGHCNTCTTRSTSRRCRPDGYRGLGQPLLGLSAAKELMQK